MTSFVVYRRSAVYHGRYGYMQELAEIARAPLVRLGVLNFFKEQSGCGCRDEVSGNGYQPIPLKAFLIHTRVISNFLMSLQPASGRSQGNAPSFPAQPTNCAGLLKLLTNRLFWSGRTSDGWRIGFCRGVSCIRSLKSDIKSGGILHSCMTSPEGFEMWDSIHIAISLNLNDWYRCGVFFIWRRARCKKFREFKMADRNADNCKFWRN